MYIFQLGPYEDKVYLSKEACLHIKARRLRSGDELTLFDGNGLVAKTRLLNTGLDAVCELIEQVSVEKKPQPRLVLGITKIATIEFILQKATEIGVSEIILVKSEYTPIAFDQKVFDKKQQRWDKILLAACEQSENVFKPVLRWMSFEDYMATSSSKCMLHVTGQDKIEKNMDLMIGPEGGWSEKELAHDVPKVRLDTGILRSDTACIAALLSWKLS